MSERPRLTRSERLRWRLQRRTNNFRRTLAASRAGSLAVDGSILHNPPDQSAIAGHLPALYWSAVTSRPRLILEVGVRDGESTRVLAQVAEAFGSVLVSADIEDIALTLESRTHQWVKWKGRSQDLGRTWESFCTQHGFGPEIDYLFVDSSHEREQTEEELQLFMPHLSASGVAAFHDTNMNRLYMRRDGSIARGWDNRRGVVEPLQDYTGLHFDEKKRGTYAAGRWVIDHEPSGSGLTLVTTRPT